MNKTFEEFAEPIYYLASTEKPQNWRYGQAIFNYTEKLYGDIARRVQFEWNIDCFYDDSKADTFLRACYIEYQKQKQMEGSQK